MVLFIWVRIGEDICALEGLREESEDVVDDEEGAFGVRGTGDIGFQAVDDGVGAFGLVVFRDDGGGVATWMDCVSERFGIVGEVMVTDKLDFGLIRSTSLRLMSLLVSKWMWWCQLMVFE